MTPKHLISLVAFMLLSFVSASAAEQFVNFTSGDLLLSKQDDRFNICVSDGDNIAVKKAAATLCNDFKMVTNATVSVINSTDNSRIIAGTIGMSAAIDQLVKEGKIDGKQLKGKVEKYILTIIDGKVVIAGSDRRGTIYGIYELSRQMGVSPWYYWMDVPVNRQQQVSIKQGVYTDGEPAVRYRGIFLNDEAPCLTTWVKNTFNTNYGGHEFYEKVFELLLRLKGNYMWPAMWTWAFYADDPENSKTADEMGIMMGTSHHEPMARNHQEWARHRKENGEWDYRTNQGVIDEFFRVGIERAKNTEDIITIGMRGDGDTSMGGREGHDDENENLVDKNMGLMKTIIDNQRKMISKITGKKASEVPQIWALYKEVQEYYDKGLRTPDDVIMLLCDDNWGDVRRVPNMNERKHKGGWGLYYHVDYVGAPRNSKTLNVTPAQNMMEQLSLAYDNGIQKLWILNVGDLKPMEYPIQMFMDMAWEGTSGQFNMKDSQKAIQNYTAEFCKTFVGEEKAAEAADLLVRVCKLNGRSTPEMLDARTYNLEEGEWETVINEYQTLEVEALRMYVGLSKEQKDAFFQAILFPIQLMGTIHQMYHAQAMNNALYKKGDAAMNEWADKCEKYFKRDGELMKQYNKDIAGGKWDGMMIQKHIGYTSWNDSFREDMLPKLYRTENVQNIFEEDGKGYISMEAEHFFSKENAQQAKGSNEVAEWTVIPGMGRTLSGVTLHPTTADVTGASLTYKFKFEQNTRQIIRPTIHIITKSTLDFLNKKGMTYSVALDGGEKATINFNHDMNEDKENIYSIYYPTIARRIIEKTCELPLGSSTDGIHTLTFTPNDPGIVIEKIIIDFGGYKKQYLFGKESLRK